MGRKRAAQSDYDSDDGFVADAPSNAKRPRPAAPAAGAQHADDSGDPFWALSATRRVTVTRFGGKMMVNIREYYEKDAKLLPGKKGISLTVEHFAALVEALPGVEKALLAAGERVPRPRYEGEGAGAGGRDAKGDGKKNFEATSDEDEGAWETEDDSRMTS